jgi:hypothetical protein
MNNLKDNLLYTALILLAIAIWWWLITDGVAFMASLYK